MIAEGMARRFAHQAGVDLVLAQQDIVLLFALDLLAERGVLNGLAFKGGTYLRKMILGPSGRISEDLDFTAVGIPREPEPVIAGAFATPHHGVRFRIADPRSTEHAWACTVAYKHDWGDGRFQFEISYREAPSLPIEICKPVTALYTAALPFTAPQVPCLQMPEALAEKIRAMQQRGSDRDFYDLVQYSRMALNEELVRMLSTIKLWNDGQAFDARVVLDRLATPRKNWKNLEVLVGRKDKTNWNRAGVDAARRFGFLAETTRLERRLMDDCRKRTLSEQIRPALEAVVAKPTRTWPKT